MIKYRETRHSGISKKLYCHLQAHVHVYGYVHVHVHVGVRARPHVQYTDMDLNMCKVLRQHGTCMYCTFILHVHVHEHEYEHKQYICT
jgi:hypothetical protein